MQVAVANTAGVTPLHHTAYQDHMHIVRLLLQHRADVKMADSDGKIPLH